MKTLQSLLFACVFAFAAPLWAQAVAPDVPEIAPAPAAAGKCDKCKEGGMGKMAHGEGAGMQHGKMEGMACCKGKPERAGGKCEQCREGGMGRMAHGDMEGMGGMQSGGKGCCGGMMAERMGGGGCCGMQRGGMGGMGCGGGMGGGDTAALERRVAELEKRLDLMQQLLAQPRKR